MDRTFHTVEEAWLYLDGYLQELVEHGTDKSGDRPAYRDEIDLDLALLNEDIYETLKDMGRNPGTVTADEILELHGLILQRDAVAMLGKDEVTAMIASRFHLSPQQELETLIRSIGLGYHPDTPYHGYEPPITEYTEDEWRRIHQRFHAETDLDIYEFGLNLFHLMEWEQRPVNGAHREVNGVHMYWAESLNKWVTIPE